MNEVNRSEAATLESHKEHIIMKCTGKIDYITRTEEEVIPNRLLPLLHSRRKCRRRSKWSYHPG